MAKNTQGIEMGPNYYGGFGESMKAVSEGLDRVFGVGPGVKSTRTKNPAVIPAPKEKDASQNFDMMVPPTKSAPVPAAAPAAAIPQGYNPKDYRSKDIAYDDAAIAREDMLMARQRALNPARPEPRPQVDFITQAIAAGVSPEMLAPLIQRENALTQAGASKYGYDKSADTTLEAKRMGSADARYTADASERAKRLGYELTKEASDAAERGKMARHRDDYDVSMINALINAGQYGNKDAAGIIDLLINRPSAPEARPVSLEDTTQPSFYYDPEVGDYVMRTEGDDKNTWANGGLVGYKCGGHVKRYADGGMAEDDMAEAMPTMNPTSKGKMAGMQSGDYVIPVEVLRFYGRKFFQDMITKAQDALD